MEGSLREMAVQRRRSHGHGNGNGNGNEVVVFVWAPLEDGGVEIEKNLHCLSHVDGVEGG